MDWLLPTAHHGDHQWHLRILQCNFLLFLKVVGVRHVQTRDRQRFGTVVEIDSGDSVTCIIISERAGGGKYKK